MVQVSRHRSNLTFSLLHRMQTCGRPGFQNWPHSHSQSWQTQLTAWYVRVSGFSSVIVRSPSAAHSRVSSIAFVRILDCCIAPCRTIQCFREHSRLLTPVVVLPSSVSSPLFGRTTATDEILATERALIPRSFLDSRSAQDSLGRLCVSHDHHRPAGRFLPLRVVTHLLRWMPREGFGRTPRLDARAD